MKFSFVKLVCLLVLASSISACTVLGVETESTTTEYKEDSGLESRVERMENRLERLERRLESHIDSGR